MLRRMVGDHKSNWKLTLFSALWTYITSVKTNIGFTSFQLVYGLEVVLHIECEILSLKFAAELLPNTSTEEENFLYILNLDETRQNVSLANESHKKRAKAQYDKSVQPRVFNEGDLVLTYDQKHDKLGKGKLESMCYGPYIISKVLENRPMSLWTMMRYLSSNLTTGCY